MALQLWETLKEALPVYTTRPFPTLFFTVVALGLTIFYIVSRLRVEPWEAPMDFIDQIFEIMKILEQLLARLSLRVANLWKWRDEHPVKAYAWAARDESGVLSPFNFSRRSNGDEDVTIKVLYCGICHTDLHYLKNDWGLSRYPLVPGHEIIGIVTEIGSKVEKFKIGDRVGVGCLVGSCGSCENCKKDLENYCPKMITTYCSSAFHDGTTTYGGYSDIMVVNEHFVVRVPEKLTLEGAAPLLCAGITVYSPLKYYGLDKPGMHIGVVGLGGLGHLAVKFAKAFGHRVTVISTSPGKKKEAIERLGVDSFLLSTDQNQMEANMGTMHGILDTVPGSHSLQPLLGLLKFHAKLIVLGAPKEALKLQVFPLLIGRKVVAGSAIGGLKETQEMMDFAAEHKILANVEVIPMNYVNTAMERLAKGDVKYRFVIDVGNTLKGPQTKPCSC